MKPAKARTTRGVLLLNLGSPDEPTVRSVRKYLREFLWDGRVLDIHPVVRFILLHCIILPFRSRRSSEAYSRIWTEKGSPLIQESYQLALSLSRELARRKEKARVVVGMRYGRPSVREAMLEFERADILEIDVLPLYPQYASASTGSILEELYRVSARQQRMPFFRILPPFYDAPGYLQAQMNVIQAARREPGSRGKKLYYLFSFHGLPERQIHRADPNDQCKLNRECCLASPPANPGCYRGQCFQTAYSLARRLRLKPEEWSISFQSRLGSGWLDPDTEQVLKELPGQGHRDLVLLSPSFVADCLETLEELDIRGRQLFLDSGGRTFLRVPCLNSHPSWVSALADLLPSGGGLR